MAKFVSKFTGQEIDNRLEAVSTKHGASYFDPATNTMLYFASKEDLANWLSTADSSLIIDEAVMNFTGTMYQVKIESAMPSKNLYFTTQAEKAEITVSFVSQKKGITDVSWQDIVEDYNVSVYIDRGSTGAFTPLILDQFVMSGKSFTFDVRKALATGTNRIRIVAVGTESADKAQGSEVFIVNLTSMYLAPSNFTWYKPFIEGETYILGGMNIGGSGLNKILKIKVSKEGYEKLYEIPYGTGINTDTAYTFNGLEFPSAGTGVYNVELWLDANGLESDHLSYNIICVSQADKFTAQLVAIGSPAKVVYNFSDNALFEYSIYNGGTTTGSPHIKVSSIVNTNPTVLIDEDLVDVATGTPLTYTASLEIEMEDESATLQLEAYMTYGNEQQIIYPVDNSKSYPATTGAVFYMNPSSRNNAQSNREKVINSITGTEIDAVFTRMAWTDGTDGWTTDEEGRKCLRLPAGCTMDLAYQPMASVAQKTIELVYKVKNAADYDEPIFSICSDVNDPNFRGIVIRPKNILIHSRDLNVNDSLQDYNTTDEETLHVLITIIPNYKTNYGNLAQIYVNGDKVRSFSFETADRWDVAANMKFGSNTADTYWYKARVYDKGFEMYDASKNTINSLATTAEKEAMKAKMEAPLDDSYNLSYDECVRNGLNTMVIEILDQDQTVPSISNPSAKQCNLWVKINNPIDRELDEDFARFFSGEIIENQTVEGQGTTAMTYARWNFRWKLTINKRRITAKKNFASSMHSHKMGGTRLFNDLNRAIVGPNDADARVAVYQYPVYGFQKIRVEGTTDQYTYMPIGLYTIGPDKGDKKTFGFDDERFESSLIHMEGTDHTPKGVGMDYPWEELAYSGSAEALGAVNASGSVVAAWEVGAAGEYDPKDNPTEVKAMLDEQFKPAYDVAEKNSTYILGVTETLAEMNADISAWQARSDAEGRSYASLEFFTDGVYDLYFYNTRTQKYEARGINMLTDLGVSVDGLTLDEKTELFKEKRRERFVADWETYWHKNDAIFHYAFVLVFGATDNFKKNTYPYKFKAFADGGKYRWRQDDLDTLFDINNQGLAAKIYSILVGDKTDTGSGSIYRGDTSVFWTLIKECFPTEIKAMVHAIFDKMVELCPASYGKNTLEKLVGCIRYYFWDKAQEYFPTTAYCKDAEWTYEDTWAAGLYKEVNPLQQSLGGHREAEVDWVTMRMLFCAMYFNYGPFGAVNDSFSDTSTGQIAYGGAGSKKYVITMACDGNPTILRGQSELVTYGDRVKAGDVIELTVPDSSGADTRIYIQGVDWMEDIGDLSDLQVSADNPQLSVASKRLQTLKIGDEDASKVTTNVEALNFGECPSMMIVDARNAKSLTGTIDLSKMPRLMKAYFGGTAVKSVNVPNGSKIVVLQIGEETTQVSLMNLKFMALGMMAQHFVPNFQKGEFYYTSQGVGVTCPLQLASDVNFDSCLFDCEKYDTVTITGTGGNNARLWCFLDDKNVILSVALGGAVANNLVLEVPEGAAKMVCGFNTTANPNYSVVAEVDGQDGFQYTSLPKLEFLRIENCPQLSPFQLLKGIYNTDGNAIRDIRIIGFDVNGDSSDVTMIANLAKDVDKNGNPHTYNGIDAEGKPIDNSHPIIEGRLRINDHIYEEDYLALKDVFANLAMEFLGFYFTFIDPEINAAMVTGGVGDGYGITKEDITSLDNLANIFAGNTLIQYFPEFEEFTGITYLSNPNKSATKKMSFSECESLKEVSLPAELTILNDGALSMQMGAFFNCLSLVSVGDTSHLVKVGDYSFYNCVAYAQDVYLPSLEGTLGKQAYYATAIKKVLDLGNVEIIDGNSSASVTAPVGSFAYCESLREVNLPESITEIRKGAFGFCTALNKVIIVATTPPALDANAFYGSNSAFVIQVPANSVEAYKTATNWSAYADRIIPISSLIASLFTFRRSGGGIIADGMARIETIRGNSLVWNQQLSLADNTKNSNGVTATIKDGVVTISGQNNGEASSAITLHTIHKPQTMNGHKMLLMAIGVAEGAMWNNYGLYLSPLTGGGDVALVSKGGHKFFTWNTTSTNVNLIYTVWPNKEHTDCTFRPALFDLTHMFGAGNEPTTIEEFYERKPLGIDEYAYNKGEVIHMNAHNLVSVGVNQWDEEWENGRMSSVDGTLIDSTSAIRSANYFKVIPNTAYYATYPGTVLYIFWYDSEFKYIGHDGMYSGSPRTSPANAAYAKFYTDSTSYNNDICINLSDPTINGKYFAHVSGGKDLGVISKYFPDGMKSAGSVHDEIRYNDDTQKWEAVKRIGKVDMGTLKWGLYIGNFYSSFGSASDIKTNSILLCSPYNGISPKDLAYSGEDKAIWSQTNASDKTIVVRDTTYTDAASFKAAMAGVMLYYELAEPIVTELDAEDQSLNLDYNVWNNGTERVEAEDKSAPFNADILYGVDM